MTVELDRLYANRFDDADKAWKRDVWEVLWRRVFTRWVAPEDVLVDVGAGYCEFVNAARAARRIAVDVNPASRAHAADGVEFHSSSADDLSFLRTGEVDVVFASNILEHLPDKATVSRVIEEARRVLRPGGRLILMGPNIRVLPGAYWDYYDHNVPLSDKSLCEALVVRGFQLRHVEPRFLPYTVKRTGPRWKWLVEAYLSLRPVSSAVFGKQFLLVAIR